MSWACPKCERELPKPGQRHYCARVSLDSLFQGCPPELVLVFDKILAEVADWDGVLVGTTPNCIVFTRRLTFLVIRPMKKELDLKFYSKVSHPEKPYSKARLRAISLKTISGSRYWTTCNRNCLPISGNLTSCCDANFIFTTPPYLMI